MMQQEMVLTDLKVYSSIYLVYW